MPLNDRFPEFNPPAPARWSRWRTLFALVGVLVLLGAGAAGFIFWWASQDLPSLESLSQYQPSQVSRVYSDDRQVVGQFYVERRLKAQLADVPQHLTQAVIAVEDARFFEHPGLDFIGIARAVWTNLRRGGKVEGASTITQQLARSLFLSAERTYGRKIRELILAYKMELILSKEEILELYLNQIYFGQGAYGVVAAAQTYFGKSLSELTLGEAAMLAGLPKSPNNYSPYKNLERAKKRQEHVLLRMEEAAFITVEQRLDALTKPLMLRRPGAEQVAPYFIEHVRQHVMGKYGETMVYKGGLEIFTTLNVEMQKAAEQALNRGLRELDKRQGWRGPIGTQDITALPAPGAPAPQDKPLQPGEIAQGIVTKIGRDAVQVQVGTLLGQMLYDDMAWAKRQLKGRDPVKDAVTLPTVKNLLKPGDVIEVSLKKVEKNTSYFQLEQTPIVEGALVVIDPRNGSIRAMVGGYDFVRSEYNRVVTARRQPGSAFKPIIYAAAFNEGLSPSTVVVDSPVIYENEEDPEKTWKPENYGKRFHGPVSLREALIHSHNVATVRLLKRIGIKPVVEFAKTLGIASPLNQDLSLALGSSGLTPLEMVSAYAVFANQGYRLQPYSVATVQDANAQPLEQILFEPQQVITKETAYLITNVLEDVIQKGTGQLAKTIERSVAGKTGTTNDFTDAWFIGYTPNLAAAVWIGFDDIRTLGETESGAHAALPIWLEFMQAALPLVPPTPFEIPEDIRYARIDPRNGLLAPEQGEQGIVEVFTKGAEPTESAPEVMDAAEFYRLDQIPEALAAPPPAPVIPGPLPSPAPGIAAPGPGPGPIRPPAPPPAQTTPSSQQPTAPAKRSR
ncbi:MAG: PBP1A family penicillin-binding protein [Nitrospiraceae bacterium]|nr:PBP1A family penicillin-binding protein [Nitrospiraceae bacterium]